MSEQDNWLDRQRRMVKCKRHGLHFDPKMASGCYLCLKEAARSRVYKQPKFLVLLISTLAMVLILYKIFGPSQPLDPEEAPLEGLEFEEETQGALLDPAPYRRTLVAFEEALFGTNIESSEDLALAGPRLASVAGTLSATIVRDHPGTPLATSLEDLRQKFPREGFTFKQLKEARKQWLRIRKRYLAEVSWWQEPPAEVGTAQVSLTEYQTLSSDLISFLEEGATQARAMSAGTDRGRWEEFQSRWRERFKDLARRSPIRPRAGADAALLLAYQSLDQAMRRADALSRSTSFPGSDAPFEAALQEARRAQEALREVR